LFIARLIDHRIHADGGLARRAVTDDQFALATANRNHRVNGHDAGLDRLADGFAPDDAGRDFFHWIKRGFLDRPLAVHRAAQTIHHATKQTPCRRARTRAGPVVRTSWPSLIFANSPRMIAPDFGFLEIQRLSP
jgi:hypothetical protein